MLNYTIMYKLYNIPLQIKKKKIEQYLDRHVGF